jgi:SET domain-containing protein
VTVQAVRNGNGLVASKPFRCGATILRIDGEIVTDEQVWRYWDVDPRRAENCFRFDEDHYLDPEGELGAFANHSCNPNAGAVKKGGRLYLVAIRDIAAGDEVTHDYSTLLGADDGWRMRCNCGEANCRKIVKSFPTLPASVRQRYQRLGVVPGFVSAGLSTQA